jgi:uncharacterized protein (DUF433 family)
MVRVGANVIEFGRTPDISFGKPVVTHGAIRTDILYDALRAEGNKNLVARLYEVPVTSVEAAIAFEESLAA